MKKLYAAMTGDVVKSRRLTAAGLKRTRRTLTAAARDIASWRPGLLPGDPQFFRGDAWQLVITDPSLSLRAALYLRAALRAGGDADTRISIGIGPVEKLVPDNISASTGQALSLSGEQLDRMPAAARLQLALPQARDDSLAWPALVVLLCSAIADGWRERQAATVRLALAPQVLTQAEIAQRLRPRVTQQTVAKALAGAGWPATEAALGRFEATRWDSNSLSKL